MPWAELIQADSIGGDSGDSQVEHKGMAADLVEVENRLWAAAVQLWANTGLKPSEFSTPVLGLIFLRYADKRLTELSAALLAKGMDADELDETDFQAQGVLYLPQEARLSHLLALAEGAPLGKAIASAMSLAVTQSGRLASTMAAWAASSTPSY